MCGQGRRKETKGRKVVPHDGVHIGESLALTLGDALKGQRCTVQGGMQRQRCSEEQVAALLVGGEQRGDGRSGRGPGCCPQQGDEMIIQK